MRIRDKVALVGGIPIVLAAAIAAVAWLLLNEAERARKGAVVAGAAYRDLTNVTTARNNYVLSLPGGRNVHTSDFSEAAGRASVHLAVLGTIARDDLHRAATEKVGGALRRYREQMGELQAISQKNDQLTAEMNARASRVIILADRARERQHQSNADIIRSLTEGDRRLRTVRDIVDRSFELRAAAASLEIQRLSAAGPNADRATDPPVTFARARLRNAVLDVLQLLRGNGQHQGADALAALARANGIETDVSSPPHGFEPRRQTLAEWVERLTKVASTEQRALHDEMAQLLTYSVEAAETEQATQNVAIATLKLGGRAAEALSARDTAATDSILNEAQSLSEMMSTLPISPLIQTEMIEAIQRWREGLATTTEGLRVQNAILGQMDAIAQTMAKSAATLNDMFTDDADRMGRFVQSILLLGAALGLLLGSGTAILVARSITRPLKRLEEHMRALAANPAGGMIPEATRQDELGAMARAANFFVTQIGRREHELRDAKNATDNAMQGLKEAQTNLIQAEKLASLGQLVAGVAHEINTPIGVALTTSTAINREVARLTEQVRSGRIIRSEMQTLIGRLEEGAQLVFTNLTRAIDLIQSFKQVSADRASGEKRSFELQSWLQDLVRSLSPVLRKGGHRFEVDCPQELTLHSYPGALAQVLTNLTMNAVVHAFPAGQSGVLRVSVWRSKADAVTIEFTDNGIGVSDVHRAKVFDPFFTTGRDRGSTGLGLHIVHNLVTATLHGRIDLQSRPGQGATFIIEIPVAIEEVRPEALSALNA